MVDVNYQAQLVARHWRFEKQPTSFYGELWNEYGSDADAIWVEAGRIYEELHNDPD